MYLLHYSSSSFPNSQPQRTTHTPPLRCSSTVRSNLSLPFSEQKAKYYKELQVAVNVVERACHLCVNVQKSLFSRDGNIVEKNDQTPVTIADFGVQAIVSLEMGKHFPLIPLVAEEDSGFLRSNNLVDAVFDVVSGRVPECGNELTQDDVLEAIDRGGKDAYIFGPKPATYWVLDPIDGTRGFVKGSDALYVVGLALVVEGEIVLGVMGCPNWQEDSSGKLITQDIDTVSSSGVIMISHVGCGTWKKKLWETTNTTAKIYDKWNQCFVDNCNLVNKARFYIPESQTWESLPLSDSFNATNLADSVGDKQILLLSACCGSLCKYLMVASGSASVFIVRAKTQKVIKAWDHAVGIICVHEAGGKVTDWRGSRLDFAADQTERRIIFPSGGVLATNNSVHDHILGMISRSS